MLLTKGELYYKIGNIISHAIPCGVDFSESPDPYAEVGLSENDALIDEIADLTIDFERPTGAYDDVRGSVRSRLQRLENYEINHCECYKGIMSDILDYRERIIKEGR